MINKNELRIGNLVSYSYSGNTHNGIVEGLGKIYCESVSYRNVFVSYPYKILIPIPIDEKWLEMFGYNLITENHYSVLGHLILKLEDRFYCDKNGVQIKYVHQLQNLFFSLTGNELTLNE